jgi:hypothetical protein
MVHPPQATESPSLSGLVDGTWADSSKYPYAAQAKAHQEKEKEKDTSKFINELDQILQSGSS